MIDWTKSAELNKCTIMELKARFVRFPKSHRKVVAVCELCDKERVLSFSGMTDLCYDCAVHSPERSEKLSQACEGRPSAFKGKHHTDDAKKKLSDAGKGKQKRLGAVLSDETKLKISIAHTGKKMSAQSSRKKSEATKGTPRGPYTDERIQHVSAGLQGIPYDEWTRFATNDWREWDKAVYLNEPFPGCHRHHLTQTIVACIPDELHNHIQHVLKTGYNMGEMNMLALQFIHGCYDNGQSIVNNEVNKMNEFTHNGVI